MPDAELDRFLQLVSNPFRTEFSRDSLFASIGTSLGVTLFIFLAWCLIRPHNTIVYAPKLRHADEKHAPPKLESGLFGWWKPVWYTKEAELVEKIGVDAVLFLRVLRMCRTIVGILGLLSVVIVIPVNVLISKKDSWKGAPTDPLVLMTPMIVWGQAMWAHVVMAWLFDAIIMYILWRNYKAAFTLRKNYFESEAYQIGLSSRTLMVTDIPNSHRTDDGLARIIGGISVPSNNDENCVIGRAVKDLPGLIEQHSQAVYELEAVLAKYLKNPNRLPAARPSCKPTKDDKSFPKGVRVDAIDYWYRRIDDLEKKIYHIRDTVDSREAEQYGFISYPTITQAHIAALAAKRKHIKGTTIQLAPKPQDIIWENLGRPKKQRRWNEFLGNVFFALLSLGYVVPNAFIAVFLSDISRIAEFWTAFRPNFYGHPKAWAFVQGVLTPVITAITYLLLPIIFRRLSRWQGDLSKTARERHVTHKLYAFFIFNNLIIFTIFSIIWEFVSVIVKEATKDGKAQTKDVWEAILAYKLATKLTMTIFRVSPFWMMYLLQRNMGAALDLAQLVSLLWGSFSRRILCLTPRQIIIETAPPTFDYATFYTYFLFYFTIALAFATLQPLMLVIAFVYFSFESWLKKYLLMYVFVTKVESGGAFWRLIFNRLIFATAFSNVIVAVVVWVQYDASLAWVCVVPLPLILIAFKIYCSRTFDSPMHYHTKGSDRESIIASAGVGLPKLVSRRNEKLRTRFGHPALYKPLIHPMVRANAQHILAEIYKGRTNTDNAPRPSMYGEIDLDAMQRGRPGKKLGKDGGTGAVDFVEESEMDFSRWKHMPGFAEEHSDVYSLRGSVYGGDGWSTPMGLRGLDSPAGGIDSPRSSIGGDGFKRPHFSASGPSGSRPGSPLSAQFVPKRLDYHGVPTGSPQSGSRPQSPSGQAYNILPPPSPFSARATSPVPPPLSPSPLHIYPPQPSGSQHHQGHNISPHLLAAPGDFGMTHDYAHSMRSGASGSLNGSGTGSVDGRDARGAGGGDADSMAEGLLGHQQRQHQQ